MDRVRQRSLITNYNLFNSRAECSGSLEERATRIFSLKGLKRSEYPKKVRGKNFRP